MVLKPILLPCSLILFLLNPNNGSTESNLQNDITLKIKNHNGNVLLRKRRFLQFPAGSSFQLVFCLTYPSVGVGSYFVFGHTAAVAFELPSTTLYFNGKDFQKKEEEPAEATTTETPKDYPELEFSNFNNTDHKERIDYGYSSWDLPYDKLNREFTFINSYKNPFMDFVKTPNYSTKRRANYGDSNKFRENLKQKPKFEEGYSQKYSHMTLNMDPKFYSVHRRSRREIYQKIESFLTRLNVDGKACLLKAICETRKSSIEKGTFLQESFKAIFRAKPHDEYKDEDEYDIAFNLNNNCDEMYSKCKGSVNNIQLLVRK